MVKHVKNDPISCEYSRFLHEGNEELFEPSTPYRIGNQWSERHLQCVWYNAKLRPSELTTTDGEPVQVVSSGRWNLEAGPDFLDAALMIGKEQRRVEGDVEVHIRPSAWTRHGHAKDPRYAKVVLHVTYHPGPRPPDLPQAVYSIVLREPLLATPRFSFDDIDLAAYPHALLPQTPRPCQTVWGEDPDKGIAILQAAGHYRFDRKKQRMGELILRTGDEKQALYEGVMAALGYKRNTASFRLLAQSYPLAEWIQDDPLRNYATLLGLAGLLPHDSEKTCRDEKTLAFLWRHWWRNTRPEPDAPIEWHLDSTRPSNHPRRRLAAAASLFSAIGKWLPLVNEGDLASPSLAKELGKLLREYSLWPGIAKFLGEDSPPPSASRPLLGESRAAVIVNNAVMPFLAATHPDANGSIADNLRPETISGKMTTMANRLFGRDHNPVVLYGRSGLCQQGLLQIYSDFCLNSRDHCKDCPFGKAPPRPSDSRWKECP